MEYSEIKRFETSQMTGGGGGGIWAFSQPSFIVRRRVASYTHIRTCVPEVTTKF